nr:MAG TPA: hypothetical protein [Bacteriophage sp.]
MYDIIVAIFSIIAVVYFLSFVAIVLWQLFNSDK